MKRCFDETLSLSDTAARELADFYHYHLVEEIMPHWRALSLDTQYGGYETNFNENWEVCDSTKNVWAQTRDLIMFTLMYQYTGPDPRWMELIQSGHDFLVQHFYAGNGVWNYRVSNDGLTVLEGPISLLGDMFAMGALARYMIVTGDQSDLPLLEETYRAVGSHLRDSDYRSIMPHVWRPGLERHSHYMLMVNVLESVQQVLGSRRVHPLLMECIDKILFFFAGNPKERDPYLLEYRRLNGSMEDSQDGHLINPGHIFESMWFCLKICIAQKDTRRIRRIMEITDYTFDMAIDREHGGIFHLLDCTGRTAFVQADKRNRQLNWNDKVDWVNAEALYLFALIAVTTEEPRDFLRFIRQHNYCQTHFYDREHGDWITTLSADGTPIANQKGTKHRCAFHLPRAILDIYLAFDTYSRRKGRSDL